MKQLLIISVIITSLSLFSCEKLQTENEKTVISEKELVSLVINDPDYSKFICEKKKSFSELDSRINSLSEEERISLYVLFNTYQNVEELKSHGTKEEINFYWNAIGYNQGQINYSDFFFKKLDNYNYSTKSLISIIDNSLRPTNNLRTMSCREIYYTIYFNQLNYWWVGKNYNFKEADEIASESAGWAYVGCLFTLGR